MLIAFLKDKMSSCRCFNNFVLLVQGRKNYVEKTNFNSNYAVLNDRSSRIIDAGRWWWKNFH